MAIDLSETLVIGVSATALFDLSEADKVFRKKLQEDRDTAIAEYRNYMLEREDEPLADGTAMPLVTALLNLNSLKTRDDGPPLVLEEFWRSEDEAQDEPLPPGPHAELLKKLYRVQERLGGSIEYSPVRIAIVTARNMPAEMRVLKTLRRWGVYVDQAFFLGGLDKTRFLKAFRPHIFFDDQDSNLDPAAGEVPSAKVLYPNHSPLRVLGKAEVIPK